jgi:hypothetical protein
MLYNFVGNIPLFLATFNFSELFINDADATNHNMKKISYFSKISSALFPLWANQSYCISLL